MNYFSNVNEAKIMEILYNEGPVMAAVDASNWMHYLSGIIQYHCRYTYQLFMKLKLKGLVLTFKIA